MCCVKAHVHKACGGPLFDVNTFILLTGNMIENYTHTHTETESRSVERRPGTLLALALAKPFTTL